MRLSAAFFALAMASYYILKPLREAYFLHSQGIAQIAKVHVVVALVTFVTVQAYSWLTRRWPGRTLVTWVYATFVLTVVGFWATIHGGFDKSHVDAFVWTLYIWVSIFSVFAVTLFWSMSHDIFTSEEGSRYYGVIGAAGILGGFLGSLVTSLLVEKFGIANLFLVSASLLVPCVSIAAFLAARAPSTGRVSKAQEGADVSPWKLFRGSPYLSALFLYVFLYQGLSIVVDQQTKQVLQQHYHTPEAFAKFQANVYNASNLIGTLINLFVAGFVQTRFGPLPGLVIMPVCALAAAVGFRVAPTIEMAAVVTSLGLAIGYSIQQSSKELLYLPVPSEERYVAKAFIDTFGFRLGNGMTSVWLWMAVPGLGAMAPCAAIVAAAAGMIMSAGWLVPRHNAMLETSRSLTT